MLQKVLSFKANETDVFVKWGHGAYLFVLIEVNSISSTS